MPDIGTYHLRIEFYDATGYIDEWTTGARYTDGMNSTHPLTARRIPPPHDSEDDLIACALYNYREGNWSCDCNRSIYAAHAQQKEPDESEDSGICRGLSDRYRIRRFTIINPHGSIVYNEEPFEPAHR